MRTWRYIRRVDDDDDEITVFCVQLICLMIPLLFPSLTHSCGGVLFLHLFFSFCLLAGLGRLGIFFKKKRAFVWGASTARFIVPLLFVTYSLLHTYPYTFNAMVGTEASLRRLLLVGIWGFLVLFF